MCRHGAFCVSMESRIIEKIKNIPFLGTFIYVILLFSAIILLLTVATSLVYESTTGWIYYYLWWILSNNNAYISIIVVICLMAIASSLFNRLSYGFAACYIILYIFGFVNKIKYYNNKFFLNFWDVLLLDEVSTLNIDLYSFFSGYNWVLLFIGLIVFILLHIWYKPISINRNKTMFIVVLCCFGIALSIMFSRYVCSGNKYEKVVSGFSSLEQGTIIHYLNSIDNDVTNKFNGSEIDKFIDKSYKSIQEKIDPQYPTIIAIMSESFWNTDYLDLIEFSKDPMEIFKDLALESDCGELAVNTYGGLTFVTEFEFLTGINSIYLNRGDSFYKTYCKEKTNSYVSYLEDLGYNTFAVHSGSIDYFSRGTGYTNLGFNMVNDINSFDDAQLYRGYISDKSVTKKIIDIYNKNKMLNQPLFIMNVTIANHVVDLQPDTDINTEDTYAENISILNSNCVSESQITDITEYANGINESLISLKELIDYFRNVEDDVVIVFFGDHAPEFADDYMSLNQDNLYRVPYLIWNNFNAVYGDMELMNASYFLGTILNKTGYPVCDKIAINNYMYQKYPVHTMKEVQSVEELSFDIKNDDEFLYDIMCEKYIVGMQLENKDMDLWRSAK